MQFPPGSVEQLQQIFDELNRAHFDGFLERPALRWNTRLRSSAGRFMPGSRKYFQEYPVAIEVASYLLTEPEPLRHIRDTLGHEMIHYWLWVRRRPYGHTEEFWQKMQLMGVSRYNPVPKTRPYRYLYHCPACAKEYPARRKLGILACARCCNQNTGGRFDLRYRLELKPN